MQTAFTDASGRVNPDGLNLGAGTFINEIEFNDLIPIMIYLGTLSGQTLAPGLYKWTSGLLVPTDLTFQGSATDSTISPFILLT